MTKRILGCNIDFRSYDSKAQAVKNELTDDMLLSAVSAKTGVEPSAIQNWVKRGYLGKAQGKKYSAEQVAEVIILNNLKNAVLLDKAANIIKKAKAKSGVSAVEILSILASVLIRAKRFNSTDGDSLKSVINIELREYGNNSEELSSLILITALCALCADYKTLAENEAERL